MKNIDPETIREHVRARYGSIAEQAGDEPTASVECCGGPAKSDASACCAEHENAKAQGGTDCGCSSSKTAKATPVVERCCATTAESSTPGANYASQLGYSAAEQAAAPAGSDLGLGCGNPVAIAGIKPGETVLDLGSGAGFDCFLAARQLASTGKVIGVDMTAAMITKARRNAAKSGFTNVEFRLGEIEALPVADASVELIISNCVINLSPEKSRVFAEAFRVLKPGGRLAIADVVERLPLPEDFRQSLQNVSCCIGGATPIDELRAMLAAAGFRKVDIELRDNSRDYIKHWTDNPAFADFVVSANVTAYK